MKKTKSDKFEVKGMVCASCEKIIARQALKLPGVKQVKADHITGLCEVVYDPGRTTYGEIIAAVEEKGYICAAGGGKSSAMETALVLALIVALVYAYNYAAPFIGAYVPSIGKDVSMPLLFVIGLFTGFHCIAMCGGFVVSYTAKNASEGRVDYASHIRYGLAKTLSYAFFGAVFGLIGSYITFTPGMRGLAAALAGLFLMLFGLNMLGYLRWGRRLRIKAPKFMDSWLLQRLHGNGSPVAIGLLNGLMIACGPLQAIYLLAASTGSPYTGAAYLAAFGLGTLPLLLGFGAFASKLSLKMTNRILRYSGVVVLLLGLVMVNRGIALSGINLDFPATPTVLQGQGSGAQSDTVYIDSDGDQVIRMNVTAYGWQPDRFVLKTGVPVRWIIDGQQLTSCNNAIQVPKYGLKFNVKKGLQTIEFTPNEAGTVPWSCWMGMIQGTFIVKDDVLVTGEGAAGKASVEAPSVELVAPGPTTTSLRQLKPLETTQPTIKTAKAPDQSGYQTIRMNVTYGGFIPNKFVLKKGVPVKWVIDGQGLTGCNSAIKVPSLGLSFDVKQGIQTIEFTPEDEGNIQWSCRMGMMKGVFVVTADASGNNQIALDTVQVPAGGSCGMGSGGGCGCGMM